MLIATKIGDLIGHWAASANGKSSVDLADRTPAGPMKISDS